MGDWENSVGVELINSAANGTVSEYDHLITKHSKSGRAQAYRREAFLCFTEATNLGSEKGAYNLGICYEQGIGTAADVNKVYNSFFYCNVIHTDQDTLWVYLGHRML